MTAEPKQYSEELTTALTREMYANASACRDSAARAQRTTVLAAHALENYEPGSPWLIAEQTILEGAQRCYMTETANADAFGDAAQALEAMAAGARRN